MKFKCGLSILIASLLLTSYAFAKEGQSFNDVILKMKKELRLSDQQAEDIKPIIKENMMKRQQFFESIEGEATKDQPAIKAELRKLKEKMNQKLSTILSEEQMKKLIEKQHLRESLNKDKIDYTESLVGPSVTPEGASLQF